MSKLEVREIGPISGETDLTLGQSGGTVTLADGATAIGFGLEIDDIPEPQIKAWVRFNGSQNPPVTLSSKGVSSITDTGLGQYKVNFTNPFADADKLSAVCTPITPGSGRADAFVSAYNTNYIGIEGRQSAEFTDFNNVNLWVIEESA